MMINKMIANNKGMEIVLSTCNDENTVDEVKDVLKDHKDVKVTIYEKCGRVYDEGYDFKQVQLSNIGREQHTFAHHFNRNYDDLAERTICVADNWKKHPNRRKFLKESLASKDDRSFKCHAFGTLERQQDFKLSHFAGMALEPAVPQGLKEWSDTHLKKGNFSETKLCYEGMMAVQSSSILANPRSYYEDIEKELATDMPPEAGHYMERLMKMAYDSS